MAATGAPSIWLPPRLIGSFLDMITTTLQMLYKSRLTELMYTPVMKSIEISVVHLMVGIHKLRPFVHGIEWPVFYSENSENHRASEYTSYEVDWVIGIPDNDGKPQIAAYLGYQSIEIWYTWPQMESYLKNPLIQHGCEAVDACVKLDKIQSFVELWYFTIS